MEFKLCPQLSKCKAFKFLLKLDNRCLFELIVYASFTLDAMKYTSLNPKEVLNLKM